MDIPSHMTIGFPRSFKSLFWKKFVSVLFLLKKFSFWHRCKVAGGSSLIIEKFRHANASLRMISWYIWQKTKLLVEVKRSLFWYNYWFTQWFNGWRRMSYRLNDSYGGWSGLFFFYQFHPILIVFKKIFLALSIRAVASIACFGTANCLNICSK